MPVRNMSRGGAWMDDTAFLESRIKDLSGKTFQNEYATHTDFLSVSDQAVFHEALGRLGVPRNSSRYNGTEFVLWGGYDEAERKVCVFLPSYMDAESFVGGEAEAPEIVSCLKIAPLQARFADELTHRDYLGALMNLGIERGQIGDILIDRADKSACCFVIKSMADFICNELGRVKHTSVAASQIRPAECLARPEFEEREGSVASERLDAVLAFVCKLARGKAQELIEREDVIVSGRTVVSGGYALKPGERVSVRRFGKFIYEGTVSQTKKGRLFVRVRIYK